VPDAWVRQMAREEIAVQNEQSRHENV